MNFGMPNGSPHSNGQAGQVEEVCRRIFRHLLHRKETCRQHIAEEVALSPASATNYSRWLSANDFLETRSVKVATSKRPVEWMRLNPERVVSVAVSITPTLVRADLVSAEAASIWHREAGLRERCQHELMQALGTVVGACLERARKLGQRCSFAGISVTGTVGYGIIFSFDGIADWRPCTPTELLREFEIFTKKEIWTCLQCKIVGFKHSLGRGDSVGYFEWDGRRLRMASMLDGTVRDGRNGTVNAQLHRPVEREGPVCYCGRRGCFVALLEHGEAKREHVDGVIESLTGTAGMDVAAVEWRGDGEAPQRRPGSRTELIAVEPVQDFSRAGLRLLCAEETLLQAVREVRR